MQFQDMVFRKRILFGTVEDVFSLHTLSDDAERSYFLRVVVETHPPIISVFMFKLDIVERSCLEWLDGRGTIPVSTHLGEADKSLILVCEQGERGFIELIIRIGVKTVVSQIAIKLSIL